MVSVDVKHHERRKNTVVVSELRSCVIVKAAALGSPSLIVCRVSVDVKQH